MKGISPSEDGSTLELHARPKAGRVELTVGEDGILKVKLTAPPEDGKANKQLLKVISEAVGVAPGKLRLVKGEHTRTKAVFIPSLTPGEIAMRLKDRLKS